MERTVPKGVRLTPQELAALNRAAASDNRPAAALIRHVLLEWLKAHGWLEGEAR